MTEKERIELKYEIVNDLWETWYKSDAERIDILLNYQKSFYNRQLEVLNKYNADSFEEAEKKLTKKDRKLLGRES